MELSYILGKVYSEPWDIQNPSIFRTRSIFITLVYLKLEAYSEPSYIQSTVKHFEWNVLKKTKIPSTLSYIPENGAFLVHISLLFQEVAFQFQKEPTLKKIFIFWEMKVFSPKPKNLLIFNERILKV